MTKKITIPIYSDPAHAWLKVPKSFLSELGIDSQISDCSHKRGDFAYLECDKDATTLINTMVEKGIIFRLITFNTNRQSKIRSYHGYNEK